MNCILYNKEKTSILKQKQKEICFLNRRSGSSEEVQLNEEKGRPLEKSSEARIKGQSIREEAVTKILQIVLVIFTKSNQKPLFVREHPLLMFT